MPRYKLIISYDGSNYSGFQSQNNKTTIQSVLEDALKISIGNSISIVASGRTDAGVSAIEQVCHFDTTEELDIRRIMGYTNAILPKDIRVVSIERVGNDFHARYNAKQKTYEYLFYVRKEIIPVYDNFATHIEYDINVDDMRSACKYFIGEHDFTSFCASNTEVKSKVRTIIAMDIEEITKGLYKLSITGNGFLYNMVRIIMGTLVSVGQGKITASSISNILSSKDRSLAGKTMPSKGLYLKKVEY